ncbi:MAG: hypothetical protein CM15mP73_1180 [Hyphomicrobiales bacterium]|nr:MAG: hypothetical protein CM15mP73_1180 [Hyphomicrobiales bacterium]
MDQLNEIIQGLESGEVKLSESVDKIRIRVRARKAL